MTMFTKSLKQLLVASVLCLLGCGANASTKPVLLTQVDGVPWGLAWLAPSELLFTLREGRAGLFNVDTGQLRWLSGLPSVAAKGQGGLFDVNLDASAPNWIYFSYSKPVGDSAATTLARAKLDQTRLVDWQDLLVTVSTSDTNRHFGGRIAFDHLGHVFLSVGERGVRANGQDLTSHAGSILRLNLDGSVPVDNPFLGRKNALPQIYSYGHRNPQGLCYDSERGGLWESEHGPRGGDEVNWILPGRNYGWAEISYGKEYWGPIAVGEATERADVEPPRKVYIPSIAPGSLLCYRGKPDSAWHGNLFLGALKLEHLNYLQLDQEGSVLSETRLLSDLGERIRALLEAPDGSIIYSTDSGKIMRLAAPEQDL